MTHPYTAFDYDNPGTGTNANLVPGQNLDRAIAAIHNVMIAGGTPVDWNVQKLNTSDVEVEDLPDKVIWTKVTTGEKLRATLTRDGNNLVTVVVFAFAEDGTTFSTIKTLTPTRGTNDGVKSAAWS